MAKLETKNQPVVTRGWRKGRCVYKRVWRNLVWRGVMELYYIYIDCGGSYMTMYICQSSQTYLQAKIGKFYYMQNISDFNNERKKKKKGIPETKR